MLVHRDADLEPSLHLKWHPLTLSSYLSMSLMLCVVTPPLEQLLGNCKKFFCLGDLT
jgi:hypothetical protein